jgi:glutathione-specific gamma-glutamylcyclotransferase
VPRFFPLLWGREMSTGSYSPRWLSCVTEEGPVKALVFVMNRASPAYIAALPEPELLAIVRRASGRYGPCIDYVVQTAQALRAAGIHDRRLAHVARLLTEQRHTLPEG